MQFFILTTFKFNNPPNYKNFIFSKFNSFLMQIKYNNNRNYYCYYFVKIILVFIVLFFSFRYYFCKYAFSYFHYA